jgi:hypothetical protein
MSKNTILTAGAMVLAASSAVGADFFDDFNPTSPVRPSAGILNDWLRQKDPYMAAWDLGVQARMRYEIRDNFGIAGGPATSVDFRKQEGVPTDNAYLLHRIKPRIGYTAEWFSVFVEGRSSGSTGDKRNPNPESDGPFELHQAYVTVGNHKEFPVSLKIGRQELSYGDERLIGAFDWNNIGRVFDAAKLRWQNPYFAADLFSGRVILPRDNHFNMPNDYDWFSGLYLSSKLIPKQITEFYVLSRNTSAKSPNVLVSTATPAILKGPAARDIYTAGVRVKSNPGELGNWDYSAELIGQYGHFNDPAIATIGARSLEHEAFAVYAGGGYTWMQSAYAPRVGLEYNFASGDSNPNDDKHETFENLFPTNHKFYGYMDLVSLQNIHNVRLTATIKPLPRLTLQLDGHAFWLADTHDNFYAVTGARRGGIAATPGTGYGINPNYDSYVGSEVDLIGTYAIAPYASLQVGYGHFFRGEYVKQSLSAVGSGDANWVYIQTTFSF